MKFQHRGVLLMVCLALLGFTACEDPTKKKPVSVGEAITKLENTNAVPTLNHDTTLLGPDANNNKVRDDLDAYIDGLPDTAPQKAALRQSSSALSGVLVADHVDPNAVRLASKRLGEAVTCIYARYPAGLASRKSNDMERFTINTKNRVAAYAKHHAAINGQSFTLPQGDGCAN